MNTPDRLGGGKEGSRRVTILGSTGSVGRSTVDLLLRNSGGFEVEALTANRNPGLLAEQARALRARFAAIGDPVHYPVLKEALAGSGTEAGCGTASLSEAALRPADWVMAGIVGAAGLEPTLAAVRRGRIVAFANKEVLVCAGSLFMQEVAAHGATLLPVDSEHNAIWQCFDFTRADTIEKVTLTCSGGPFRERDLDHMREATVEQAVAHPTWNMGAKITIDSATLMNKGLEVIEAHWLFGFSPDQIGIVVHPESVVHSMIELVDGSVIAQMGVTDMRHAIQYALTYPERHGCELPPLDLTALSALHFESPDLDRFPCIALAYRALRAGGTLPAAMNAANEEAVQAFIDERIILTDIPRVIEAVMDLHQPQPAGDLAAILAADEEARLSAATQIQRLAKPTPVLAERGV